MNEHSKGLVLVADDEATLCDIIAAHLRGSGFDVLITHDGATAVQIAHARRPDVIVMDVNMPRMDGVTATRTLKADTITGQIPVILLTGKSTRQDVLQGLGAGALEYICKPFDMAELVARVQSVYRQVAEQEALGVINVELGYEIEEQKRKLELLYDYTRDLTRATNRNRILDMVITTISQLTGANRVSLMMKDHATGELVCERATGIDPQRIPLMRASCGDGVAGQVYRSGRTVVTRLVGDDQDGTREYTSDSYVSTPIVSTSLETSEGILGIINVTEKPDGRGFSPDEIDGIRSIADTAAIALHNIMHREEQERSISVLLQTVGHLAEYRDEETTAHLKRVAVMAKILARELASHGAYSNQVNESFIQMLVQAAPMHDIGKVGIPDEVLTKPGKLTDEEFQIMKTHTDIGRRVLSQALLDRTYPVPLIQMCIDIAYCHHEKWSGTGYPRRIKELEIPLAARIIALVDAYDAITSERRYSRARPHGEAVQIISSEKGKHFDPVIADAFLRCEQQFDEVRQHYAERTAATEEAELVQAD